MVQHGLAQLVASGVGYCKGFKGGKGVGVGRVLSADAFVNFFGFGAEKF
jgi:hypothetical protein